MRTSPCIMTMLALLVLLGCGPGPAGVGAPEGDSPPNDDPIEVSCEMRVELSRNSRLINRDRTAKLTASGFDAGSDIEFVFLEYVPDRPGWEPRTIRGTWNGLGDFRIGLPVGKWYVEARGISHGESCSSPRDSLLVVGFEPGTECDYTLDRPGHGSAIANVGVPLRWRIIGELPQETVVEGFLGVYYLETAGHYWEPPFQVLQQAGVIAWLEFTLEFLGEYHYAPLFYTEEWTGDGKIYRTRSFERLGLTAVRN